MTALGGRVLWCVALTAEKSAVVAETRGFLFFPSLFTFYACDCVCVLAPDCSILGLGVVMVMCNDRGPDGTERVVCGIEGLWCC